MALQNITYSDKSTMNSNSDVPAINKVQASDMNQIKSVVNNNANVFGDYIVESGGNYIKYANGTLIQWGSLSVTVAVSTAMGSVYRTSAAQGDTFGVSFYYAPLVIATPHSAINSCYINTNTTTGFTLYPISYTSLSAANREIYWLAIGRWKSA